MLTLQNLIDCGAISNRFRECSDLELHGIKQHSASQLNALAFTESDNIWLVADNCKWIAIVEEELDKVTDILSSDGDKIFCYRTHNQELVEMVLTDGMLATVNITKLNQADKKFRRNLKMSDITEMNFGDFGDLGAGLDNSTAFGAADTVSISGMEDGVAEIQYGKTNRRFFQFVNTYGKLCAFIVNEPPTVKACTKSVPIKDPTTGRNVLVPEAPAEIVAKHQENKSVPKKWCQSEKSITFEEKKPKMSGAVIAIPQAAISATDALADIADNKEVKFNENETDTVLHVLGKEQAITTIIQMFHGLIKEDTNILGDKATTLIIDSRKVKAKDGTEKYRPELKVSSVDGTRKSLLIPENIIPLKIYKTASQQNPTDEEIQGLNMHLEGLIKDSTKYETFSADTKKCIKWNEEDKNNHVTSTYFTSKGSPTPIKVARFYDKNQVLNDVQIPLREKVEKKDKSKGDFTYKFVTADHNDLTDGPLSLPQYKELVTSKLGMTEEEFIKQVSAIKKRASKSKAASISIDALMTKMNLDNPTVAFTDVLTDTTELSRLFKGLV